MPARLADKLSSTSTPTTVGAATPPVLQKPWRLMLLLSNLTLNGGAEVQTVQLAISLKARGWNVQVVSMLPPRDADAKLARHGIPVLSLGIKSKLEAPASIWRLARIIRRERPHVIHAHMSHAILLARIVRLAGGAPVSISTLHGLKMYTVKGDGWRLRELFNSLTDRLSDVTTVVCPAAARHYLSSHAVSRKRLRVVPNGIQVDDFGGDPEVRLRTRASLGLRNEFAWLLVGRFQPVKDHYTMMRAFQRVAASSADSVLLLAGDGPLLSEMKDFAQALGIGDRVRFLGSRTDISQLMTAADACVLSSMFEAMPMVLLEAAASGLPSVATDVGGNCDIVVDGRTGFLAPPSNPEALAGAMLRLLALGDADRTAMGKRARSHVSLNFRADTVANVWEELYTELLDRKGIRP